MSCHPAVWLVHLWLILSDCATRAGWTSDLSADGTAIKASNAARFSQHLHGFHPQGVYCPTMNRLRPNFATFAIASQSDYTVAESRNSSPY